MRATGRGRWTQRGSPRGAGRLAAVRERPRRRGQRAGAAPRRPQARARSLQRLSTPSCGLLRSRTRVRAQWSPRCLCVHVIHRRCGLPPAVHCCACSNALGKPLRLPCAAGGNEAALPEAEATPAEEEPGAAEEEAAAALTSAQAKPESDAPAAGEDTGQPEPSPWRTKKITAHAAAGVPKSHATEPANALQGKLAAAVAGG